jgi:hypothetical protein
MGANIFSGLLKENFNLRFWSMALATLRNIREKNIFLYGERFVSEYFVILGDYQTCLILRRAKKASSEYFVILADYQTCSAETEAEDPEMMSVQDLLFGSVRPPAEFKVRAWKSHLPPHYNYMYHCGIQALPEGFSSS